MRIRSLILIVAAAGVATLAGCTNNNRQPGDTVLHGQTIESTDPNVVRYAPLVVYIAPGETPPYGTMKFKPAEDK